jgi:hypothetical protein
MNQRSRSFFLLAILVVFVLAFVAITVIYRGELRAGIVQPFQQWLFNLRNGWLSMDADFRWSVFIVLLAVLLLISFPAPGLAGDQRKPPALKTLAGRIGFWQAELRNLLGRGYVNRVTVFELRRLVLEVVSFRRRSTPEDAEEWLLAQLAANAEEIPPALRWLVDADALSTLRQPSNPTPSPFSFLGLRFGVDKDKARSAAFTADHVREVIIYLENILEAPDGKPEYL